MAQKKIVHQKQAKNKKVERDAENELDIPETEETKSKKPVDLEAALEPASVIEEKIEEDPLVATEDPEEDEEGLSLDDDELNPFQDKWEQ
jgi:hypothetical protein